jgi:copper resistance protein C
MSARMFGLRALGICLLCLVLAGSLYGHAILVSAAPAANQVVSGPDIPVKLRFNSRIDAKRSRITLVTSDGRQTGLAIETQTAADVLSTEVKGLKRGAYTLQWQVLAADGHITRGEVPFQVQ